MTAWGCSDSIELTWEISFSVCRLELELALVLKRRQAWNSWRRMGKELLEVIELLARLEQVIEAWCVGYGPAVHEVEACGKQVENDGQGVRLHGAGANRSWSYWGHAM